MDGRHRATDKVVSERPRVAVGQLDMQAIDCCVERSDGRFMVAHLHVLLPWLAPLVSYPFIWSYPVILSQCPSNKHIASEPADEYQSARVGLISAAATFTCSTLTYMCTHTPSSAGALVPSTLLLALPTLLALRLAWCWTEGGSGVVGTGGSQSYQASSRGAVASHVCSSYPGMLAWSILRSPPQDASVAASQGTAMTGGATAKNSWLRLQPWSTRSSCIFTALLVCTGGMANLAAGNWNDRVCICIWWFNAYESSLSCTSMALPRK